jgi:2-amino-4-hydroxy-6-hydroxymethyldihydropteridine diphosphokinase
VDAASGAVHRAGGSQAAERVMARGSLVYVGLGGNLGDARRHVSRAIDELNEIPGCSLLARSSLYRSAPMGPVEQGWFVNAVAGLRAELEPLDLLHYLQDLERSHGRVRGGERWGPRTLDLDILLFGDRIVDRPGLTIPHPGLTARNFVVYPLLQLAPDLVLPDGRRLTDVASRLDREGLEKMELEHGPVGSSAL